MQIRLFAVLCASAPGAPAGASSDRELLRTLEAVPSHCHALRQDRSQLSGGHPSGGIHGVVGLSANNPITPSELIDDTP